MTDDSQKQFLIPTEAMRQLTPDGMVLALFQRTDEPGASTPTRLKKALQHLRTKIGLKCLAIHPAGGELLESIDEETPASPATQERVERVFKQLRLERLRQAFDDQARGVAERIWAENGGNPPPFQHYVDGGLAALRGDPGFISLQREIRQLEAELSQ